MNVKALLGEGGWLAANVDGFRYRYGQLRVAQGVEAVCNATISHLLAEAPTGTGKSFAYLYPLALWATEGEGRQAIVATAQIALQDQLADKDLPAVTAVLKERGLRWAVLKGVGNYVCNMKPPELALHDWLASTTDGDISRAPDPTLAATLTVSSDECAGKGCPKHDECWYVRARERAASAHIVVTNHALVMMDVKYANQVLPPAEVMVLDEGHEVAEQAREHLGFELRPGALKRAIATAENAIDDLQCDAWDEAATDAETAYAGVFESLHEGYTGKGEQFLDDVPDLPTAQDVLGAVSVLLTRIAIVTPDDPDTAEEKRQRALCQQAQRRLTQIGDTLRIVMRSDASYAFSFDGRMLKARLLDPAGALDRGLFSKRRAVVTSATLTPDGTKAGFDVFRREIGAPLSATPFVAPTPFDLQGQMRWTGGDLWPNGSWGTRDGEAYRRNVYNPSTLQDLREFIRQLGGGVLVLLRRTQEIEWVREGIADMGFAVHTQTDNRREAVAAFKADADSILIGVNSYWTGVDVPGMALRGVFVWTLPKPQIGPVELGLKRLWTPTQYAAWYDHRTDMVLRQGVGRLIRSESDYGVIHVADGRFWKGHARVRKVLGDPKRNHVSEAARLLREVAR
jgi:ATP-dependent DNA helicase DinG